MTATHGSSGEAGDRARERARSAIAHLVRDTAGDDAFRTVPIVPGGRTPDYADAVTYTLATTLREQLTQPAPATT